MRSGGAIALLVICVAGCATPKKAIAPAAVMPPKSAVKFAHAAFVAPPPKITVLLSWNYGEQPRMMTRVYFSDALGGQWQVLTNTGDTNFSTMIQGRGFFTVASAPDTVAVQWTASASPNVVAYRIYSGSESGVYTSTLQFGNVTNAVVEGLKLGMNFLAATAVDNFGSESSFSNEADWEVLTNVSEPQQLEIRLQ